MRSFGFFIALAFVVFTGNSAFAQVQPSLENGFKDYGSVHGSSIDSVNLTNGNWMLHAPLIPDIGQRGDLTTHDFISVNSKNWQIKRIPNSATGQTCFWVLGRTGPVQERSNDITVHRTIDMFGSGTGTVTYEGYGYTINTADGATHQMYGIPGTEDANGDATVYESLDTSGYHLTLTGLDSAGVWGGATVLDRQGKQYTGTFGAYQNCPHPHGNQLPKVGGYAPVIDDAPFGDRICSQTAVLWQVIDANGNVETYRGPNAGVDTVGRGQPLETGTSTTDFSGCVSRFTLSSAFISYYFGPGGTTQQIKACYAAVPFQSAFSAIAAGVSVIEAQNYSSNYNSTLGGYLALELVTIILADGSKWTFDYDSYLEVTSVGLPTGGSISLTWTTINFSNCNPPDPTYLSRAVASRTLNDNNGHSYPWNYSWGTPSSGTLVNTVTDPLQNDIVHTFTALSSEGSTNGCFFYETRTQDYLGTGSSRQLLKQVDTTYSSLAFDVVTSAISAVGNVVPTSVQTAVYPSGKVSLVTKSYDSGLGTGAPIFGNVTTEKDYDWGQGAPGPLLRETDTTYKWQVNAAYLTAHMLDLPASVVVKDANGNSMAETDYTYDEPAYLTSSGVTTQHGTAPASVRGNLTTVTKWLNTSTSPVVSHTNWYDTGEAYKAIDPLGNTTTHSYSSAFAGAYPTQTCNALSQCVSGNYDFSTGLLTSFIDANGNTSNYSYDLMSRLTLAQAPPDPSGNRPQTSFTYSPANVFPLNLQRSRTITTSLSDVAANYYDGLGRVYRMQHTTPDGNATVDTTYDGLDHVVQMTNPYYSTTDPTYGIIQTQYDALGRPTQVTKQDGSFSSAQYDQTSPNSANADCTTTTDEAGKSRKTCVDIIGRLIEVDEPATSDNAIQGGNPTASIPISGSLASVPDPAAVVSAAPSTPIVNAGSGDFYYLDSSGHVREITLLPDGTWARWSNFDVTANTGAAAAIAGSQMSGYKDASGRTYVLYVTTNQHLEVVYCNGSTWFSQDLANTFSGVLAAAGTPIVNAGSGDFYYLDTSGHAREMTLLPNGTWAGWGNYDVTANTGAAAAIAGSQMSGYKDASGRTYVLYVTTNQHLEVVYSNGSTWFSQDLTNTFSGVLAAAGTPIVNAGSGDFYYLDTSGHAREMTLLPNGTWAGWGNFDVTANTGAAAAIAGGQVIGYKDASGRTYVLYVTNSQHLEVVYCNGSTWFSQDLTNTFSGVLAAASTPIVNAGSGDFYYLDTSGHVREMTLLPNGTWAGWGNFDVTANTGAAAAIAGSQVTGYKDGSARTYVLHVAPSQDLELLEYNNPWSGSDLSELLAATKDSGTISLTVGGFSVTVCYGYSSNPACVGQPINSTPAELASALAQALNVAASPVTATASGTTLNLTWKSATPSNTDISGLTVTYDQPNIFAGPSFTNAYVTLYAYDALGNLLSVNQKGDGSQSARVRTFTYDSLSRLLTATNPESGTISYSYDAIGNLLRKTSPAPNQTGTATQTVSYCYDALNRVTGKAYSATGTTCPLSSPAVTYTYDVGTNGIGHLTSMTDQAGSASYGYDALGRITGESRTIAGIQKTLSYTYNLDNSVATLTYPSTAVVTYTPDAAGRILSAVDSGNNISYVKNAIYDPTSALAGFVSGNSTSFAGITNSFSYNKRLQPVNMSASSPTATVFSIGYDFHLGNGDNGNVFGITNYRDTTRNQTFTYDALNRLTSAQNAGTDCTQHTVNGLTEYWGNSYGYDSWGNLLQKTPTKCSPENLSVSVLSNNQLVGYGYDSAGNMTHDATTGNNYSYDQENRITGAAGYTYTYDADGNRVEKSNGTTGTIYWYMTPGIVAESDLTGALKSEYIFFDGDRVARKDFPGNSVFYYCSDHLKTASVITDSAGTIKEDEDYYPWGGELQFVNTDSNHYKFTSKERDSETGLDYFGARYYANWLGRFLTPDWAAKPITVPYADFGNPQSLNLYSYVENAPLVHLDIDGHQSSWEQLKRGLERAASQTGQALKNDAKAVGAAYAKAGVAIGSAYKTAATSVAKAYSTVYRELGKGLSENPNFSYKHISASDLNNIAKNVTLFAAGHMAGAESVVASRASSTIEALQGAANRAAATVGSGSGPVYGTAVHAEFAAEVQALGNPNLATEQSYLNGAAVNYGTPGSIRVDVVEGPVSAPTAIYDLKTGNATLTPGRIQQIRSQLPPASSNVPVTEIKPQ